MTDVTPTITPIRGPGGLDGYKVVWAAIGYDAGTNINGTAYSNLRHRDRSVQVTGTFGSGGHVKFYGSNDGTNWFQLTDPQGTVLDFSAAGGEAVLELTQYFRPTVTAGDGSTSITVTMILGGR